jgi:RNA polymerase sigma-70 factor (ECF subfamily)
MRQEQAATRARALLARLPAHYRAVLSYRLLDGLSVAETARCMGTSEGNVKILQHRALKRAAELWEEDTADG